MTHQPTQDELLKLLISSNTFEHPEAALEMMQTHVWRQAIAGERWVSSVRGGSDTLIVKGGDKGSFTFASVAKNWRNSRGLDADKLGRGTFANSFYLVGGYHSTQTVLRGRLNLVLYGIITDVYTQVDIHWGGNKLTADVSGVTKV